MSDVTSSFASLAHRPFVLVPAGEFFRATTPPEYLVDGIVERGASVGFIGAPETGKSLLALHLAGCISTGQPFFGRPTERGLVVYLMGEGHSGAARRLQALEKHYQLGIESAPFVLSKVGTSLLEGAEVRRVGEAIRRAEADFGLPLALLVIDTAARFITPGDESKAQDLATFFAAIDELRGNAAALICHHPGHKAPTRARGSSNWKAALDAEYTLEKQGDVVTLTCQKMKDGSRPPSLSLQIQPSDTSIPDERGGYVQSVVLVPSCTRPSPSGKNQQKLLAELQRRDRESNETRVWTEAELRAIARGMGMQKSSASNAVQGLHNLGYLVSELGGLQLSEAYRPATKTASATPSRTSGHATTSVVHESRVPEM